MAKRKEQSSVSVTNNLHELMLKECARRTIKTGIKYTMRRLDDELAREFNLSKHSIMAIRQNKYQPKIEDAWALCQYFDIEFDEFFNFYKDK